MEYSGVESMRPGLLLDDDEEGEYSGGFGQPMGVVRHRVSRSSAGAVVDDMVGEGGRTQRVRCRLGQSFNRSWVAGIEPGMRSHCVDVSRR